MHCDPLNPHLLQWPVLLIHLHALDFGQRREALVPEQLPKDGVQPVQMRRGGKGDKKLAAVGVGALVGHAEDAPLVVLQPGADLVFEGRAIDGASALGVVRRTRVSGRAGLRHEGGDYAVEGGCVIV